MGEVKESTDVKLVKRAIRGDVEAYGEIISIHLEYLYRTAYLYCRNEDAALEIVQETILKGFRFIKKLKEPELFTTWLTRILINASNDYYKHLIPYIPIEEAEFVKKIEGVTAEERMDLYAAISKLPVKYKTVIILKYFDGLKQEEIAYAMNIPRGTVSAYLTRARQELRKCLKEGYLHE